MATERLRTRRKALVGLPPAIVEQLAEARTVLDNLEDQFAAMAATQVPAAPDAKRDLDRQRAADVRAEVSRIADPCRMLRARQVAELLNIHIVTVFKWAKSGKLPKPLKLGKTVTAWRAQDLIEFLDSKAGEVGDA